MATVLESFLVQLGFDVNDSQLNSAQTKIAALGKNILGLGIFSGLSVAGIMKLVTGTASAMAAVNSLSQRTGIATDAIQGMSSAAAQFGVSTEAVQGSLQNVSNTLGGIITGTAPRMKAVFKTLGLTAQDTAGQQKDVVDFLGDVASRIQGLSTGAQTQILSRLGINQDMVGMLRNGREAFLEMYEAARQGAIFPAEDYQRAEEFQKLFTRVRGIVVTIGRGIGLEIMRPMTDLLDRISKWWATNGKQMMEDMRGRLKMWLDGFSAITRVFNTFAKHGDTIVAVIEALGVAIGLLLALKVAEWVGGILTSFKGWGAVIAALGVLIYLIIDDFLTWRAGGESFIGYLEQHFPEAFKMLREGWARVKAAFLEVRDAFREFWKENGPAIKEFLGELLKLGATVGLEALIISLNGIRRALTAISAIVKYLTPITRDWWAGQQKQAEDMNKVLLRVQAWWDGLGITSDNVGERMKATWKDWAAEIQSDWAAAGAYISNNMKQWGAEIQNDWSNLRTRWQEMTGRMGTAWGDAVTKLRSIWTDFMGWLEPWLKRIETVFNFVKGGAADLAKATGEAVDKATGGMVSSIGDKLKGIGQKAANWLPSMPSLSPMGELAGAGGIGGMVPPTVPSVTNAQRSQTVNQQTDVNATINVTAPSPEEAAELTARKLNNLANTNVRNAQPFQL